MPLLLRHLGLHAAVLTVLRVAVCGTDDTTTDADVPTTAADPVPSGLRLGLRHYRRLHNVSVCDAGNADTHSHTNRNHHRHRRFLRT